MNRDAGAAVTARAAQLAALYREIAATRMADVPICHPGLAVAAVGFAPEPAGHGALGVLLTPWFMNLVWWPLDDTARPAAAPAAAATVSTVSTVSTVATAATASMAAEPPLRVGASRVRVVGGQAFEFMGQHEPAFGPFEACSLFSPMHEFTDQAAALATAEAVLALLRQPANAPAPAPSLAAQPAQPPVAPPSAGPARRGFLFGRSAAAPGP